MDIIKNRKFKVVIGYVCDSNGSVFYGKEDKVMNMAELSFLLKCISPTKYNGWICGIGKITKNDIYRVCFSETTECGVFNKCLKITRNNSIL